MNINPEFYKLSNRIQLEKLGDQHLGIRKVIKSRIILKDAEKIVAIVEQIKSVAPELEVSLICTKNICSKSVKLLSENNIGILFIE